MWFLPKKITKQKKYSKVHNILHVFIAILYPSSYAETNSLLLTPPPPFRGYDYLRYVKSHAVQENGPCSVLLSLETGNTASYDYDVIDGWRRCPDTSQTGLGLPCYGVRTYVRLCATATVVVVVVCTLVQLQTARAGERERDRNRD